MADAAQRLAPDWSREALTRESFDWIRAGEVRPESFRAVLAKQLWKKFPRSLFSIQFHSLPGFANPLRCEAIFNSRVVCDQKANEVGKKLNLLCVEGRLSRIGVVSNGSVVEPQEVGYEFE
jgi:hypothetical protein